MSGANLTKPWGFLPLIIPILNLADAADLKETYYISLLPKPQQSPLSLLAVSSLQCIPFIQYMVTSPYPGGLRLLKLSQDTKRKVLVNHCLHSVA